jgi:hypothetical protein
MLDLAQLVEDRVRECYWNHDWNCAVTTLRVLSEVYDVPLNQQILDAAVGMHGAGGYRAQCGLVEGALMFVGVTGRAQGLADGAIVERCYSLAQAFQTLFGSLLCRELRPGGFSPDDPPHLCEDLTRRAILFNIRFLGRSAREAPTVMTAPAVPNLTES